METDDGKIKNKLVISSDGLLNKTKKKKNGEIGVYFGYEGEEIDFILPTQESLNSSNLLKQFNLSECNNKTNGVFFKIFFNQNTKKYYLQDMGAGYGTFIKIQKSFLVKKNTIINIGETYLVFFFETKNSQNSKIIEGNESNKQKINKPNFHGKELYLKIYSNIENYKFYKFGNDEKTYLIGRSDKCDIIIHDEMLSRIHCRLRYVNSNWSILDGEESSPSTNGTWEYASEPSIIKNGMIFKSNSCNFNCKYL